MATISIIKATYSDPKIEFLLAPFGGIEQFVKKNEKVLLKVNLLSAKDPEKAPLLPIDAQRVGIAKGFVPKAQSR
jgi:uncharacterized protein (DUF362 family)